VLLTPILHDTISLNLVKQF